MNLTPLSTLLVLVAITWCIVADSMLPGLLFIAAAVNEFLSLSMTTETGPDV